MFVEFPKYSYFVSVLFEYGKLLVLDLLTPLPPHEITNYLLFKKHNNE